MNVMRTPVGHARRGRWLETAIAASGDIYARRRVGYLLWHRVQWAHTEINGVRKHVRIPSPVDFTGVFGGVAIAFDAKVTNRLHFPTGNVKPHQLDMIDWFTACTGIGFLLISFERPDLGRTYACTGLWYRQTLAKLGHRQSIPFSSFAESALVADSQCVEVVHGANGLPINFGPAALKLQLAANGPR